MLSDLASLTSGLESTFASLDSLTAGLGLGETTQQPTVETTAWLKDKWPRYSDQEILCDYHEVNYLLSKYAVLLDGRFVEKSVRKNE